MKRRVGVCLDRVCGSVAHFPGSWQSFRQTPLTETLHWMCIQHQHFYLPTCQPISSHTCYSEIMAYNLAFHMGIPLLFLSCSLNSASILGSHNKGADYQTCPPNLLYLLLSLSLCHYTFPCSCSSICLLFLGPPFHFPCLPSHPPTPSVYPSSPLWWDTDVQLLWGTTAPPNLSSHTESWASVPSDKPYNVWHHKGEP